MRDRTYPTVIRGCRTAFKLLGQDVVLSGLEHVPTTGGFLLASNHISYVDFVYAGLAAVERGRLPRFMAKRELFKANCRSANLLKEESMTALNSSFSTPMYHDDLYPAISTLQRITTYARTTVREMEVLRVAPDAHTVRMAALLHDGALALDSGYGVLEKDPAAGEGLADRARVCERRVEKEYRRALAQLFDPAEDVRRLESLDGPTGPTAYAMVMDVFKRREVYRHLSNAGDRIARAGDTLHDIVVKLV